MVYKILDLTIGEYLQHYIHVHDGVIELYQHYKTYYSQDTLSNVFFSEREAEAFLLEELYVEAKYNKLKRFREQFEIISVLEEY